MVMLVASLRMRGRRSAADSGPVPDKLVDVSYERELAVSVFDPTETDLPLVLPVRGVVAVTGYDVLVVAYFV
jgi:hypothetical protein